MGVLGCGRQVKPGRAGSKGVAQEAGGLVGVDEKLHIESSHLEGRCMRQGGCPVVPVGGATPLCLRAVAPGSLQPQQWDWQVPGQGLVMCLQGREGWLWLVG